MIRNEERNKLLKVRVDHQGSGQWQLTPETDRRGNQVRKGKYMFRGDDEQFRKFLITCKVTDTDSAPASRRNKRYADIVQDMKQNKRTYVWMYLNRWKASNRLKQENDMNTEDSNRHLKENREALLNAANSVVDGLTNEDFVADVTTEPYTPNIGGDEDPTSLGVNIKVTNVGGSRLVIQLMYSYLDNGYTYSIYDIFNDKAHDLSDPVYEVTESYTLIPPMVDDIVEYVESYEEQMISGEGENPETEEEDESIEESTQVFSMTKNLKIVAEDGEYLLEQGDQIRVIPLQDSMNGEMKDTYEDLDSVEENQEKAPELIIAEEVEIPGTGVTLEVGDRIRPITEMDFSSMHMGDDDIEPDDSDIYIVDRGGRGYDVIADERFIGNFSDIEGAEETITSWMEKHSFYPSIWFVDDHGGIRPHNMG